MSRELPSKYDEAIDKVYAQTPPGVTYGKSELAKMVGCRRQFIDAIERRALAKLRRNPKVMHLASIEFERRITRFEQ